VTERMIGANGVELCAESFGDPAEPPGGAFAQLLALDFADRVRSLVLISTSFAVPTDRPLPAPTEAFGRFVASAEVDWSHAESVVEYLVAYSRVLAGARPFDEASARDFVRRELARARDFAAAQNHNRLRDGEPRARALSGISVATLVIHGTADPMFPIAHAEALADEIPGATCLTLEGADHGVHRADWNTIAGAILDHTDSASRLP
jgi:pimeloyl-ACP methyl ester carboxylesterase